LASTLRLTVLAFSIIIISASLFSFRSQNILEPLRTKSSWKTLADATPPVPCFYPHSKWALLGPVQVGVRS